MYRNLFVIAALLYSSESSAIKIIESSRLEFNAGEFNQGCDVGLKRMSAASNSQETYDAANAATGKWEDPGFPADDTSLMWDEEWGQEEPAYRPALNTYTWVRP